jgi:hypothetical protein
VAKRPCKFITLEENVEVVRRIMGGQSHPTLCKDLNMASSIVTTIIKNADKIKKTKVTAENCYNS